MKYKFLVLFAALFAPLVSHAIDKGHESQAGDVIAALKAYPVSKIDDSLPNIQFEKWLKSIVGDTPVEWGGGDCAGHDAHIDECTSFSVTVGTPEGNCPDFSLRLIVTKEGEVYLPEDARLGASKEFLSKLKSAKATSRMRTEDMIKYVRALDVHRLDPSLPSERFDKWIERNAHWPVQWWDGNNHYDNLSIQCELKRLMVRVTPAGIVDREYRTTPFDMYVDIGTWGQGIEGEPKLIRIAFLDKKHWGEYTRSYQDSQTHEKNLSALQKRFDEWDAALLARKPKVPVVRNMATIGHFDQVSGTPTGHCSGHSLDLWQYGDRAFGLHHLHAGLCGDPPCSALQEVKFNPKTGDLEFLSFPAGEKFNFIGKVEKDAVVGQLANEAVKLKRDVRRADDSSYSDHEKNLSAWCKAFKPVSRCNGVKELCQSLGVE